MNYTSGSRIMNSIHVTCIKAGAFKSTVFIIYVLQAWHVLEIEALAWQCKPTATQSFRKECFTSPAICLSRFNPQIWRSLLWDLFRFTLLQICMFVPCFPDYSKGTSAEKKPCREIFIWHCCTDFESHVKRRRGRKSSNCDDKRERLLEGKQDPIPVCKLVMLSNDQNQITRTEIKKLFPPSAVKSTFV